MSNSEDSEPQVRGSEDKGKVHKDTRDVRLSKAGQGEAKGGKEVEVSCKRLLALWERLSA